MNNKIYKLNMNKFTGYINYVNPGIKEELGEEVDRLCELFDSMHHTQPEYILHALTPAIQYALGTWLQSHGYHVDRSIALIFTEFGKDLINYGKFLKEMSVLKDLTEEEDHEQEEI